MKRPLDIYARFFETMAPRTLEELKMLVAPDIEFRDPFNNVKGVDKFIAVFDKMYAELENPKFKITDQAWGQGEKTAYLRWTFTYKKGMRLGKFEGISEIRFNNDGKVASHINHWDSGSQFLERLPMVGGIVRMIMKKASVQ